MMPRDRSRWFKAEPKKPPPEHGIRVTKPGTTWWGQRWIAALEAVLQGDSGRLARGRTYARAGRVHDLVIAGGKVRCRVTGSRKTPYEITIALALLDDAAWKHAVTAMAARAQFSAELLAGRMPEQIDEVFIGAGVSLFPARRSDLKTDCSCPDWGDPCKHVAAAHYVLGEALDRDPFLLFELRGRTQEAVLSALRDARGAHGSVRPRSQAAEASDGVVRHPSVTLGKLTAASYDRPRGALPSLHLTFEEAGTQSAVLRQLGAPTAWQGESSPADMLAPVIRAAAEAARRIAWAQARDEPEAAEPSVQSAEEPAALSKRTRPSARSTKRKSGR